MKTIISIPGGNIRGDISNFRGENIEINKGNVIHMVQQEDQKDENPILPKLKIEDREDLENAKPIEAVEEQAEIAKETDLEKQMGAPLFSDMKAPDVSFDKKNEEIHKKIDLLYGEAGVPPKKSSISKVVGKLSEARKQRILERFEDTFNFQDPHWEEKKKTPEELEIIAIVNNATNEILTKYGLLKFDIPTENNHILEKIDEDELLNGQHRPLRQENVLEVNPMFSGLCRTIFHETLHFKSYGAVQQPDIDNGSELEVYRQGLMIKSRDGKKIFFRNLNEAVTESMTKKYFSKLLSNPLFKKEQEETQALQAEYYKEKGREVPEECFVLAIKKGSDGSTSYNGEMFAYKNERHALETLIQKLSERNPERFKDESEVMEMFEKAMLTGNIFPIGKLINTTFGEETFRKIGELGEDTEGFNEFVEKL
ncbi:MAG: hypothetical protein NTZ13_01040 [Candidatus Parcubacteria bacterium]|nr:hypothetical protein [Candidatus Parcubacteria bacterium]